MSTTGMSLTVRERCEGCGKVENAKDGCLPAGWIWVSRRLYGQEWSATACSHACASAARIRAVCKANGIIARYCIGVGPHVQ